ncbi:MAG: chorismate mutase [Patescibacteria group bacterium]
MSKNKLTVLRRKVDAVDEKIVNLLSKRFFVTSEIQEHKRERNMRIEQKKREVDHLKNLRKLAQKLSIPPDMVVKIFKVIFRFAKK